MGIGGTELGIAYFDFSALKLFILWDMIAYPAFLFSG
jgi:hypothetical protein